MSGADLFDIKNSRLLRISQSQAAQQQKATYSYNGEFFEILPQFGDLYVGDVLYILTILKLKSSQPQIELLKLQSVVEIENDKGERGERLIDKPIPFDRMEEIRYVIELRMEQRLQYIIRYDFVWRQRPQADMPNPQPKNFEKKYRITTIHPFSQPELAVHGSLAPTYFIEYTMENITQDLLELKQIDFKTDLPFESCRIMNHASDTKLQPKEKIKVLFKLNVKPSQSTQYEKLLTELRGQKQPIRIGTLSLQWGKCGMFVSLPVNLDMDCPELSIEFCQMGEKAPRVQEVCQRTINIISLMPYNLSIRVLVRNQDNDPIKIIGLEKNTFKLSQDKRMEAINVTLLAINAGLQTLRSLIFINDVGEKVIALKNNLQILVEKQDTPNYQELDLFSSNQNMPVSANNLAMQDVSSQSQAVGAVQQVEEIDLL